MEEILLLDTIERFVRGEMEPAEEAAFEDLRRANPAVDQLVVEHTIFLSQLNIYGDHKNLRGSLHDTHNHLMETGEIKVEVPKTKVVDMFKKYRKVWSVAAAVAGVTAITISGLVAYFTPRTTPNVEQLVNTKVRAMENRLNRKIDAEVKPTKAPVDIPLKSGGTSFLIDPRGYLVTNAHVVKSASTILVQNNKGQEFKVKLVRVDNDRDLAILKIEDADFKEFLSLPYGFKKTGADLGEQIFTLGFPRDEIVYGEGYMSAKTGFNGDTMSCQIAVAANPGNSGGPVFNKNGEVIGILSTRQLQAQGFVFAVTANNIFRTIEDVRKEDSTTHLKISNNTSVKGMDRVQQIKKIEDCVFLVKIY
ncbi:MAG: trypsin-like peptidase domain-containing protein [Gemmatimonadaceae bacterium]|nr:trypsin-like peptidase domain-containing protein [Chitinophagaceae bacterium]